MKTAKGNFLMYFLLFVFALFLIYQTNHCRENLQTKFDKKEKKDIGLGYTQDENNKIKKEPVND